MPPEVEQLALDRSDELARFLALSGRVYEGDPRWVPPRRGAEAEALARPVFRGRQAAFLARDGARPLARAVARLPPGLTDPVGRPVGTVGFFEALDDPEGGEAVLAAAAGWLVERGAADIVGPMDGDTWHRYRLNVGPGDEPPFLLEPYNPSYYRGHWAAAGFRTLETYFSLRVDEPARARQALAPAAGRAAAAGYRLEPVDGRRLPEALDRIYELSRTVFARNFLYTEIGRDDFRALYAGVGRLLEPGFIWLARSPGGEDVGFLFAYPDRVAAVRALRGQSGPLALLRFLALRRRWSAVDVKTLGVLPGHRRSGVAAALMARVYEEAERRGVAANLCLIREGNPSGGLDGGAGRLLRRYELLHRPAPADGGAPGPPGGTR